MRWMRRLAWVLKSVLLVTSIVVCVLWMRSYWRADWIRYIEVSGAGELITRKISGAGSMSGCVVVGVSRAFMTGVGAGDDLREEFGLTGLSPGWNARSRPLDSSGLRYYDDDSGWGPVRWKREISEVLTHNSGRSREDMQYVRVSDWSLATVFGAWPITSSMLSARHTIQRRRRARAGLCLACGYDLRATPDGTGGLVTRCPECGREA